MLEVLFQDVFLLYLPKDFQQHEFSGLTDCLVPEGVVYFGKAELPKVLVCYLMLVAISQQKMEDFLGAYFWLAEGPPELGGNLHIVLSRLVVLPKGYGMLQSHRQMLLKIVKSWGVCVHWRIGLFFMFLALISFWGSVGLSWLFVDNRWRLIGWLRVFGSQRGHGLFFSDELLNVCRGISSLEVSKALETLALLGLIFTDWAVLLFNENIRVFLADFFLHVLFK